VDKQATGAIEFLQDESFAAEESCADLAGKRDLQIEFPHRAEKGVLLTEQLLPVEIERDGLAGIRARSAAL
jgi:hypothetical protein